MPIFAIQVDVPNFELSMYPKFGFYGFKRGVMSYYCVDSVIRPRLGHVSTMNCRIRRFCDVAIGEHDENMAARGRVV